MKCCRSTGGEIGGLMGKDHRKRRRREIFGGLRPAIRPFLHFGGLALSAVRQISAPHRRAPVQQAG